MKKKFLLLLTIVMVILTTFLIYSGFAVLEPSKQNLIIISILSLLGYSAAFVYYLCYKNCSSSNNESEQRLKEYSELLKEFEAENENNQMFKTGRDQMPPIK